MCGYVFTLQYIIILTMMGYRDRFLIYILINIESFTLIVVTIQSLDSWCLWSCFG